MRVVIDIEANGLVNPDKIWVICCKDIDTGEYYVFRNVTDNVEERRRFLAYASSVHQWIGHNLLGYDWPVLMDLLGVDGPEGQIEKFLDTLILSKLIDYPRQGHSVDDYGQEFGLEKIKVPLSIFKEYSKELEEYCIRDVEITYKIYLKYLKYILKEEHKSSITLEHSFQLVVNSLSTNGFYFNTTKAKELLKEVTSSLEDIDKEFLKVFPPKLKLIREVTPKATKFNTISLSSIPKVLRDSVHEMEVDAPFCYCKWEEFNPSSHKQLIEVLHEAGWSPTDKTQTFIDTERLINKLKHTRNRTTELDIELKDCYSKLDKLVKYGWKINENNLTTLPESAPAPARLLAKRILLESRRRTLTEWLGLVQPDNRIHGKFYGIGAWTHRMATQQPNVQNIPTDRKLYGHEMRSFWRAPRNRLLVGVDADSIQFRVAAHYINDPELIRKIVEGKKADKTDPHSHNMKVIGDFCPHRDASKRTLFSLILGGGVPKLAEILGSSLDQAEEGRDNLYREYPGLITLKKEIVVADAKRGWFERFDGGRVRIPGETFSNRKHLCPSGYLQCGEAVVIKTAVVLSEPRLKKLDKSIIIVNIVHDEIQLEVPNNMELAIEAARIVADAIREAGVILNVRCPLAGSYWNDDRNDYTIGTNWSVTH